MHRRAPSTERRKRLGTSRRASRRGYAETLGRAAVGLVQDVRLAARERQGLAIGVDFNAVDWRVVEHVVRTQTNFVRDEFGRRSDRMSARAREVVASGLERGLGREEIAGELAEMARSVIQGKSPFYWEVVAGAFMATGRSYAQISSYAEAGIDRYRILAVMDAHTTPLCRFLNGKTFSVATALDRFDAIDALEDPEQIKAALPWGRQARDRETGEMHIYVERDGARTTVASYPPGRRDAHSRARQRRGARRHLGVPAVPRPLSLGDGRSFLKSGIPHRSGEATVPRGIVRRTGFPSAIPV